jgi:hypothetical protein
VPVAIVIPRTAGELDAVRGLMRAFLAWHRERHQEDLDLIDRYFAGGGFERELAALPGDYRAQTQVRAKEGGPLGTVSAVLWE